MSVAAIQTSIEHSDDLAAFVQGAPSSYHAAHLTGDRLASAGFQQLNEVDDWPSGTGDFYVIRDGAIIAWRIPESAVATAPFHILGAHTDSPGFKLKPQRSVTNHGWSQVGVEVYGGPLLNSWFDRELEFAGRVVTRNGIERLVRTGPLLRIPQLAIHLDRDVNSGLVIDRQKHTLPIFAAGEGVDVMEIIADAAGVPSWDIAGTDILTVDTQAPRRFGANGELFASGRLDNLSSVHAGLTALIAAPASSDHISVLAAFDHEELGSASRSGASGPFLEDVLVRITAALGGGVVEAARARSASWCLSADAAHAVHPNYSEKHDPVTHPVAGGGPVLKLNANQRYATDAPGSAFWASLCRRAGVTSQSFVLNNTAPGGSTIGPLTATRLGIRTIDVGIPLLSMHSARELCHIDDAAALARVSAAFFAPQ